MAAELSAARVTPSFSNEQELVERSRSPRKTNGDFGNEEDEDEDEDIVKSSKRRAPAYTGGEDDDDDENDLFGDGGEDEDLGELSPPRKRQLDDEQLDSGDDDGRMDRLEDDGAEGQEFEEQERLAMDVEIPRQPLPEPSDGELYLLKMPTFMAIEPRAWQTPTFQPPTTDHHSKQPPTAAFSAFNTAMTTVRWRYSPSNPSEVQSNARINRWSDGSLTLQLASDPATQYEMDANALAPPQRHPRRPTPTSIGSGTKAGGRAADEKGAASAKDAHTYLVAPVWQADLLRTTHKVTAGLSVKPPESAADDAVERLQAALASAANATRVTGAEGALRATDEDPEAGRRKAEQAERAANKDRKRRENALDRERARADRPSGRAGAAAGGRFSGMNVGMLEDDDEDGERRGRGATTARARPKPRRRRNSEYSDDEDFGRRRFTKEDDYDEDDGFLVRSDDEEEVVEDDDDDSDDGIVEEKAPRESKRERRAPSVSDRDASGSDEGADADADADGEPDEEETQQARTKRRRIVDEDEDE